MIAVDGIPSSSATTLIFFNATNSPVTLFYALCTTPYVPSPNLSNLTYFSIIIMEDSNIELVIEINLILVKKSLIITHI